MHDNNLPREVAALVGAELQPGERITWAGQPMPWRFARRNIGIFLFGIPWTAFAIFWVAGTSGFKLPDFSDSAGWFPLFGVPFVLSGFGMLSTPYWMRRKARRTAYVVTDERALIIDGSWWRSTTIRSFEPRRLGDIRRDQNPDGSGNLIFERTWDNDGDGGNQFTEHCFLAIRDVKTVERLIRQLTQAASQPDAKKR